MESLLRDAEILLIFPRNFHQPEKEERDFCYFGEECLLQLHVVLPGDHKRFQKDCYVLLSKVEIALEPSKIISCILPNFASGSQRLTYERSVDNIAIYSMSLKVPALMNMASIEVGKCVFQISFHVSPLLNLTSTKQLLTQPMPNDRLFQLMANAVVPYCRIIRCSLDVVHAFALRLCTFSNGSLAFQLGINTEIFLFSYAVKSGGKAVSHELGRLHCEPRTTIQLEAKVHSLDVNDCTLLISYQPFECNQTLSRSIPLEGFLIDSNCIEAFEQVCCSFAGKVNKDEVLEIECKFINKSKALSKYLEIKCSAPASVATVYPVVELIPVPALAPNAVQVVKASFLKLCPVGKSLPRECVSVRNTETGKEYFVPVCVDSE